MGISNFIVIHCYLEIIMSNLVVTITTTLMSRPRQKIIYKKYCSALSLTVTAPSMKDRLQHGANALDYFILLLSCVNSCDIALAIYARNMRIS